MQLLSVWGVPPWKVSASSTSNNCTLALQQIGIYIATIAEFTLYCVHWICGIATWCCKTPKYCYCESGTGTREPDCCLLRWAWASPTLIWSIKKLYQTNQLIRGIGSYHIGYWGSQLELMPVAVTKQTLHLKQMQCCYIVKPAPTFAYDEQPASTV